MSQHFAVKLYEMGYHDLISVIPVSGQLSPGSAITPNQRGKVPGRKLPNGTWAGYNWRSYEATADDVLGWALVGANVGLRAKRFPGLDIDSLNEEIAKAAERIALDVLGPAPVRVGRAPKRLLMYRLAEGGEYIARMRLFIDTGDGVVHLIELLGDGQQYLVDGVHPGTLRPYEWLTEPPPADKLTRISVMQVEALFTQLTEYFEGKGYRVTREGSPQRRARAGVSDQLGLRAPSSEALLDAVAHIPNSNELFPRREDYIKMGYAIRAACGDDVDTGFDAFSAWATRWDGGTNAPETIASDWRRMRPPFSVGWTYLTELARGFGYNDAPDDFPAEGVAPTQPKPDPTTAKLSERWLADKVLEALGDTLRFVPQYGRWLVWDGQRWCPDEKLQAQHAIGYQLARLAANLRASATTDKLRAMADKESRRIESAFTLLQVMKLVRAEPSIAVTGTALDTDPWLLATPSGVVDLRTGIVQPPTPEMLITKLTRTGPDFGGAAPEWLRFLAEATGGDRELELYLQRLAGYCLTGSTREQNLTFIYGRGGNGKGVFLNAIRETMGDYATTAAMDTFTASRYDRHSTDLADLVGSRLVTASETQSGRRWDEQRVKQLSGGDPVKARFMRQDNFTYMPIFKLVFIGNHKPEVRDLDPALRRRLHIVPFTVTPAVVDGDLGEKLKAEYPAILAWMIEGSKMWLRDGLAPPAVVRAATEEYFEDEDTIGRWASESLDQVPGAVTGVAELFESWREWCGRTGEYVGSLKRFSQMMVQHGYQRERDATTRRATMRGVQLKPVVFA